MHIFFLFTCLLTTIPVHTGFKDKLLCKLPKAALFITGTATISPSFLALIKYQNVHKKFHENFEKFSNSCDMQRSEWAKKALEDHGLLDNKDTIPLVFTDQQWTSVYDLTIISPEDLDGQGDPLVSLLHEWGHQKNRDCLKRICASIFFNGANFILVAQLFKRKTSLFTSKTVARTFFNSIIIYLGTNITASTSSAFCMTHYSQYQERSADVFAIAHIKNPENLERDAQWFLDRHNQKYGPTSGLSQNSKFLYMLYAALFTTHPLDLERAKKFNRAAELLRAKESKNKF